MKLTKTSPQEGSQPRRVNTRNAAGLPVMMYW